jgi:(2Fe-2S) ferredoxin
MIEVENLAVPVIVRICLGKCEQGAVMRIAPGGKFFTEITDTGLQDIIGEIKAFLVLADTEQ